MRGLGLVIVISGSLLCGACLAQKVQFTPAEKPLVLERMKSIPETNPARALKLKELFSQAGCRSECSTGTWGTPSRVQPTQNPT